MDRWQCWEQPDASLPSRQTPRLCCAPSLLQRVPAQNTHFHRGQEPYYHKHLTVLDGIACVCPFQAKTAALLWATAAAAWSCTGCLQKLGNQVNA